MSKMVVQEGFGISTVSFKTSDDGEPPEILNPTRTSFTSDFGEGDFYENFGKKFTYEDGGVASGNLKKQYGYVDDMLFYKQTGMKVDFEKFNSLSDKAAIRYFWRKDDTFKAADGNDVIVSWGGDDKIKAGAGDDILNGWKGNDKLFGQEGNDDFYFARGYDKDIVKDYNAKADKIVIDKNLATKYKHLEKAATEYKKGLELDFGKGDVLKIQGASMDDLEKFYFNADWDL